MGKIILDGQAFLNDDVVPVHFEDNVLTFFFEQLSPKEDRAESITEEPDHFICITWRKD